MLLSLPQVPRIEKHSAYYVNILCGACGSLLPLRSDSMASLTTLGDGIGIGASPGVDDVVLIGIPSGPATSSGKANSPYETCIGGLPGYYENDTVVNTAAPLCKYCQTALVLVSQVYAPVEFDRSILIFGCNNGTCKKRNAAWKVYRTQYVQGAGSSDVVKGDTAGTTLETPKKLVQPTENGDNTSKNNSMQNTDAWANNDLDALLAMRNKLAITNTNVKEKSKKKKKKSKKKAPKHQPKPIETPAANNISASFALYSKHQNYNVSGHVSQGTTLPTTNVSIIEEPYENYTIEDSAIRKKYKKLIDNPMQSYTYGEVESDTNNGSHIDKPKAGRASGNDEHVVTEDEFYQRILRAPSQCIRYAYGSRPLLPSSKKKQTKMSCTRLSKPIPKCSACNGNRLFELQLMPPLLNIIGDANNMDWDTVLVYSCENSCPQSREEYIEAVYDADQEKYFELDKRTNKGT